jgi:PAS domain S-box-containing protein
MRTKEELYKELKKLQKKVSQLEEKSRQQSLAETREFASKEKDKCTFRMGSWELEISSGILKCSSDVIDIIQLEPDKKHYSLNDYLERIHSDDRRYFLQEIERATSEKIPFIQTMRYLKADGTVTPTFTKVEPYLEGKKLIKLAGLVVEGTSFQSAVVSDFHAEDSYRQLFNLSPSGIILENRQGIIVDANLSFCRTMGYRREELIGKHVHILAHPEVRGQVDTNIAQLLAGRVLKHNVKSLRKNGSICLMELSETKMTLPDGEEGILCIAEDFTDRLRAQEEQLQKEKFRGTLEMAGAVCHELNQPLTTIFITTDLLLDYPKQPNIKEMMTIIKNESIRIGKLTDKLMRITKYETRDYINGQKIVDIDKAVGEEKKHIIYF